MAFTGILSKAGKTKAEMAQEAEMFNVFWAQCLENQRQGMAVTLVWTDKNMKMPVFLGNLQFKQAADTVAYTYSFTCTAIRYGTLSSSDSYNALWSKLKNQIGFKDPGGGWHGGQAANDIAQIKLSKITGFPGFTSASSSGSSDASSSSTAGYSGSADMTPSQAQSYAKTQLAKYGLNPDQFNDLVKLWDRESGWNMHAENASSGAYGIPQADPDGGQGIANSSNYRNNAEAQIAWGLNYIKNRYGSLSAAWQHEVEDGWY